MNEIELIDFCEEHFTDYAVCKALKCEELCKDDDCPLVRVFNGYRAALREKAEREKGCEACGLIYKLDGGSYGTEDEIIDNKFCPMCGKRLEGKP